MSDMIDNAVSDRERPLRDDVVLPFGAGYVRLRAEESARIVKHAEAPLQAAQCRSSLRRERGVVGAGRNGS